VLANRLQSVILKVIHQNQYGFIRERNIQDYLTWAFEYLHLCHLSNKEMVILKLDFKKAFDKVELEVIIRMLSHKGFPSKWIESILKSGTFAALLNGTPGNVFHCRRGVRQGDSISPLLFVLAADLLQSIINKASHMGLLKLPIKVGYTTDFLVVQYADDTLLTMEACPLQLFTLKALLNTFADSIGLKVNYAKSSLYLINISQERLKHMAATFQCKQGELPFTYLGLPLSMYKPSSQDYLPLVGRVERRLVSTSMLLSQGATLQLVNSVLSSLVTFYLCSIKVPITIIKQVDKYMRHCLWRGSDLNAKKASLGCMENSFQTKEQWGAWSDKSKTAK
jgi:hypothetical protein